MKIINISIDLNKIDKTKIKEVALKSGGTGKFLDLTVVVKDEKDKYSNDVSCAIGQTKAEREAKAPQIFLGNGKVVYSKDALVSESKNNSANSVEQDDLPF